MENPAQIPGASAARGSTASTPISTPSVLPHASSTDKTDMDRIPRRSSSDVSADTNTTSDEQTPIDGVRPVELEKSEAEVKATRRALAASLQRACGRPRTPLPPHSQSQANFRSASPFTLLEAGHAQLVLQGHQQPFALQPAHSARLAFAAKRSNSAYAVPTVGSTRGPGSLLTPAASPATSLIGLPASNSSSFSIPSSHKKDMTIPLNFFAQPRAVHPAWAYKDETERPQHRQPAAILQHDAYTASPAAEETPLPLTGLEGKVCCPPSPSPSATSSSSSSAGAHEHEGDITMTNARAYSLDAYQQNYPAASSTFRFQEEKPEFDFTPYLAGAQTGLGAEDEALANLRMQEMLRLEHQRRQIEQLQSQHRQLLALETQRRQAEEAAMVGALRPSIPRAAFRQGDWICATPACAAHNFGRNTTCIQCSAPRPHVIPSAVHGCIPPRSAPAHVMSPRFAAAQNGNGNGHGQHQPMTGRIHSLQGGSASANGVRDLDILQQQQHLALIQHLQQTQPARAAQLSSLPPHLAHMSLMGNLHTQQGANAILIPSGRALAGPGRVQNISADPLAPCVMFWPDNEPLPDISQVRPRNICGVNQPPIMNTGNKGPIEHQPGDWVCGKCEYLNWRRRRVCQTCYPYAEGNGDSVSAAQHAERMAYVVAMCTAMGLGNENGTPPPQQGRNLYAMPPPVSSASSFISGSSSAGSGEANIVYQTPPSPGSYGPPSSSSFRFQTEYVHSAIGAATVRPPLSLSSALAAAVHDTNQASMPSPSPLLPSFLKNDATSPMSAYPHGSQSHPFSLASAFDSMTVASKAGHEGAAKEAVSGSSNSTSPALSPSSTASFAVEENSNAFSSPQAHPTVRPRQRSGDLGFGAIGSGKVSHLKTSAVTRSASLPLTSSHPAFKSNNFYALSSYTNGSASGEGSESGGSGSTSSLTLVSGPVSVPGSAGVNGAAAAAAANIWSLGCGEKGW